MLKIFLYFATLVAGCAVWLFGAKVIARRFGWTDEVGIFQSRLLMAVVMWAIFGSAFFAFVR